MIFLLTLFAVVNSNALDRLKVWLSPDTRPGATTFAHVMLQVAKDHFWNSYYHSAYIVMPTGYTTAAQCRVSIASCANLLSTECVGYPNSTLVATFGGFSSPGLVCDFVVEVGVPRTPTSFDWSVTFDGLSGVSRFMNYGMMNGVVGYLPDSTAGSSATLKVSFQVLLDISSDDVLTITVPTGYTLICDRGFVSEVLTCKNPLRLNFRKNMIAGESIAFDISTTIASSPQPNAQIFALETSTSRGYFETSAPYAVATEFTLTTPMTSTTAMIDFILTEDAANDEEVVFTFPENYQVSSPVPGDPDHLEKTSLSIAGYLQGQSVSFALTFAQSSIQPKNNKLYVSLWRGGVPVKGVAFDLPDIVASSFVDLNFAAPFIQSTGTRSNVQISFASQSRGIISARIHHTTIDLLDNLYISPHTMIQYVDVRSGYSDITGFDFSTNFQVFFGGVLLPAFQGSYGVTIDFYQDAGQTILLEHAAPGDQLAVVKKLQVTPGVSCLPTAIVPTCASDNPLYREEAIVRVEMTVSGEVDNTDVLIAVAPVGFVITGFETGDAVLADASLDVVNSYTDDLSRDHSRIRVNLGFTQTSGHSVTFVIKFRVINPDSAAIDSIWSFDIADLAGNLKFASDRTWTAGSIYGGFDLISVSSEMTSLAMRDNVVNVTFAVADDVSDLFTVSVKAPDGFVFPENCLPTDTAIQPNKTADIWTALPINLKTSSYSHLFGLFGFESTSNFWITACSGVANKATLSTGIAALSSGTHYSVNLFVKNTGYQSSTAKWFLETHTNADPVGFASIGGAPSFDLTYLRSTFVSSVNTFSVVDTILVNIRPIQDAPVGSKIVIFAPEGFTLYCRLTMFQSGTLPSGSTCDGASRFAEIAIGDSLMKDISYTFAFQVTQPSITSYASIYASSIPTWTASIRTSDGVTIEGVSSVPGFIPSAAGISMFSVDPDHTATDTKTGVTISFKVNTALSTGSSLIVNAPSGFVFDCAFRVDDVSLDGYLGVSKSGGLCAANQVTLNSLGAVSLTDSYQGKRVLRIGVRNGKIVHPVNPYWWKVTTKQANSVVEVGYFLGYTLT